MKIAQRSAETERAGFAAPPFEDILWMPNYLRNECPVLIKVPGFALPWEPCQSDPGILFRVPGSFFAPIGTISLACRILRENACPSPKRTPEPGGLAGAEAHGLLGGFQPHTISAGGDQL